MPCHERRTGCASGKEVILKVSPGHLRKVGELYKSRDCPLHDPFTAEQTKLAAHPLGSGAIESTCRQYQCRFKRTGQFWTLEGDEALMGLETFWRNGRWEELYPHAKSSAALN